MIIVTSRDNVKNLHFQFHKTRGCHSWVLTYKRRFNTQMFNNFSVTDFLFGLMWLIVIHSICQVSQKSRISRNLQRQSLKFRKLQEAIWLTVINEIFIFPPHLNPFGQASYLYELSPQTIRITQFKTQTCGLVSMLLERDFVNYRKRYGLLYLTKSLSSNHI